jgi:hypothetical protein
MTHWIPRSIPLVLIAAITLVAWSRCERPASLGAPSLPDADPGSMALLTGSVEPSRPVVGTHGPDSGPVPAAQQQDSAPAVTRAGPSTVRVTLRFGDLDGRQPPVPELLRIDQLGQRRPVEPLPAAESEDAATRSFLVDEPGRYVTAWHAWCRVPGTRTWRVVRGQGSEFIVGPEPSDREIVHDLGADELRLDPSLDVRKPGATYRFTAKDG